MSEEQGDKQFDATETKLRRAREKGDIPRSTEINSAFAFLGAAGGIIALSSFSHRWVESVEVMWLTGGQAELQTLWTVSGLATVALVAVPAAIVLVGLIVQRAMTFTPNKLVPDLSRINPVKNAKQKFGKSGIMTFLISAGKAFAVGFGGWLLIKHTLPELLSGRGDSGWLSGVGVMTNRAILLGLGVSLVFAIIDILWKRYDYRQRNRMSMKEMKDELKDSEGDPHMKSARRQRAIDLAMNPMLAAVETADVVIVNPTHYAVALEWKRGSGRAPVCVAKGVDEIAMRIRQRAKEHAVPIWPDPPAARAMHATVDLGAEIAPENFAAAAAAIRFAEKMREKARKGW